MGSDPKVRMTADELVCEACQSPTTEYLEQTLDGVGLCPACWKDWMQQMQTCAHKWHPAPEYGPNARWCNDCSLVEGISDAD